MPLNGPQLWFRVSAVKNTYVFKTHTSFLLWWPRLRRQNCNVFPAMPVGRRLKVIARVPISSNLMSSKNLTSSNNAANQINLNYSIDSTEVESLLGNLRNEETAPAVHLCTTHNMNIEYEYL